VQGRLRSAVEEAGKKLGLNGTYIAHSYIEQVQLEQLTKELTSLTDDLKERFPITESMLTSNTEASDDSSEEDRANSSGRSNGDGRKRSPGGSDSGGRPPHPRRPKSAAPTGWGGYGLDGDHSFYNTPPPRSASRGPSRSGRYEQAMERMASPSRRNANRTSPSRRSSPTSARDQGLEYKFDWLANRVEKLGELQRQASVESEIHTPGGSRVKETEMIQRDIAAVNAKMDSIIMSLHKQQLDVARAEIRSAAALVLGFASSAPLPSAPLSSPVPSVSRDTACKPDDMQKPTRRPPRLSTPARKPCTLRVKQTKTRDPLFLTIHEPSLPDAKKLYV
jgi:hypothetical protein